MFAQLAHGLVDSNCVKRLRAADAFANFIKISDKMAAETLHAGGHRLATVAMRDQISGVREAAAKALGASAKEAVPYVEDLAVSLKDDSPELRKGAARALGAIGGAALPCLRDLFVAVLDDSDFTVRYWAAEAIGRLGEPAVAYISAFAAVALYDKDETMRTRSNDALGAAGTLAGAVVDNFTVEANKEEQGRQERAAKALDKVGVPHQGLLEEGKDDVYGGGKFKPKNIYMTRGDTRRGAISRAGGGRWDQSEDPEEFVNKEFVCFVGRFIDDVKEQDRAAKEAKEAAAREAERLAAQGALEADGDKSQPDSPVISPPLSPKAEQKGRKSISPKKGSPKKDSRKSVKF